MSAAALPGTPGQNAQPAAVTRHGVLQCNFHRKIGNDALRGATRLHHVPRHPVWLEPTHHRTEKPLNPSDSLSEINWAHASKAPENPGFNLRKSGASCYIFSPPDRRQS